MDPLTVARSTVQEFRLRLAVANRYMELLADAQRRAHE